MRKLAASCKSVKLEYSLTLYIKINSKLFKDLNLRHDSIKLLKENIGKTFSDMNRSNIFLLPKAKEIKVKINKWDLIKFKRFAQQRKPSTKGKDNIRNGRKCLQTM